MPVLLQQPKVWFELNWANFGAVLDGFDPIELHIELSSSSGGDSISRNEVIWARRKTRRAKIFFRDREETIKTPHAAAVATHCVRCCYAKRKKRRRREKKTLNWDEEVNGIKQLDRLSELFYFTFRVFCCGLSSSSLTAVSSTVDDYLWFFFAIILYSLLFFTWNTQSPSRKQQQQHISREERTGLRQTTATSYSVRA